ncbi:aminopeptidase [Streptomyces sp. 12297]|uniref:aminopeptidase n=1 Tax=Streptomyces sp. NBC_00239 TaxID=2903640 RepID=UPI002E2A5928|nr:aminopeptidase [Streptomyces sp. NBC_00239]
MTGPTTATGGRTRPADVRTARLARTLLEHSLGVRAGETVLIRSTGPAGEPLVRELYAQCLARGARPSVYIHLADEDALVLAATRDPALHRRPDPMLVHLYDTADAVLRIEAEDNPFALRDHPPADQEARQESRFSLIHQQLRRLADGTLRRCTTHYPTEGYARQAGLSLDAYTDLVHRVMLTDTEDPVAAWRREQSRQQRIADRLAGAGTLRIAGADADLRMSLRGRPVDNSCGRQNLPDGELCVAPLEDSVHGWIRASGPAYLHDTEVRDLSLRFHAGRVTDWECSSGAAQVAAALAVDDAAGRIGEIGFGLNERVGEPVGYSLIDTKAAGLMSVSLGQGHTPTGSANHSPVHWTFPVDLRRGSTVTSDGEPVLVDGLPSPPSR